MNFGGAGDQPPVGRKLGGGGVSGFVKNVYYDEFQWSLVKSVTMFGVGVWIAREFVGVDFMTPV